MIREAARRGAQVILIQELFETPYFCKDHSLRHLELAKPWTRIPRSNIFAPSRAISAWCCRSAYSNAPTNAFYNSIVIVDADGAVLGSYRKVRIIPEGPGLSREVLFFARRYRIQGVRHSVCEARSRDSAGTSGFR